MTRHNLGFMLIDRLLIRAAGRRFRSESSAKVAEVELAGQRVLLAKPQTYMNLSGDAVSPLLDRYGEGKPANLLVASDDVALPFGMIRVRARGSAGGQKGLKSIIERLGTQEFARVRLGVNRITRLMIFRDLCFLRFAIATANSWKIRWNALLTRCP